jgi:DNA-binding transcriptional regulator GbsR (MarR family)
MTPEERIKQQKELIETIGLLYDKKGFQPIAGRIIALLTVMDKELFTFDEIVQELQISKSSASNALRILETAKIIEYKTITGDRKRYFQIKKTNKLSLIDEQKGQLIESIDILKSILELKADKASASALYINDIIEMLDFFIERFEEAKKEFLLKK